jgi:hypothetical protein
MAVKEIKPAMPIILCTGHCGVITKEKSQAIGIDRYISKPISNYSRGKHLIFANHRICNCLQGVGDFRDQAGVAYWSYVSQADRGKIRCPVSSYTNYRQ